MPLRYLEYDAARSVPNVVVDGAANESTVLTLSHWPGAQPPPGLARDLSAQMAFAYLDAPTSHAPAEVVTNNHLDQDGLVAVHALVDPERSLAHRDLLVDVAAAGDFGTYRDRRAARASMVIARLADEGVGYADLLPRLVPLALDPEPERDRWEAEDEHLSASEAAVADGTIGIVEEPELDLAVVTVPATWSGGDAHRFAHETVHGVHPMALHNATGRFRLLVHHGARHLYVDRYETWVQYRSRPTLGRVDLRPVAEALGALDRVAWHADPPGALTPVLTHDGDSSLPADVVADLVRHHLRAGAAV